MEPNDLVPLRRGHERVPASLTGLGGGLVRRAMANPSARSRM